MHSNSQVAYTLWPDKVHEVCQRDRSIATARRLEHLRVVLEKTQPEEWSTPRCRMGLAHTARTWACSLRVRGEGMEHALSEERSTPWCGTNPENAVRT
jgi:hypothetical protein